MGEQAAHQLIPVLPALGLRHQWKTRVDVNGRVVRMSGVRGLRIPCELHPYPSAVIIPPGLGGSHVLEMPRQHPAGEELPVGYLAALFVEQLFYQLVIYSCHFWPPVYSMKAEQRPGFPFYPSSSNPLSLKASTEQNVTRTPQGTWVIPLLEAAWASFMRWYRMAMLT